MAIPGRSFTHIFVAGAAELDAAFHELATEGSFSAASPSSYFAVQIKAIAWSFRNSRHP